jgi:DNA-binding NarL/FixJ family response regulator
VPARQRPEHPDLGPGTQGGLVTHDEQTVRVVFADGDRHYRRLLRIAFGLFPELEVVGEAADGEEAVALAVARGPDAVLLDVEMPKLDGFAAAVRIRWLQPRARLLLHTGQLVDERRRRAAALDLALEDKLRLYSTLESIVATAAAP